MSKGFEFTDTIRNRMENILTNEYDTDIELKWSDEEGSLTAYMTTDAGLADPRLELLANRMEELLKLEKAKNS